MKTAEIRKKFIEFFEKRDHQFLPPSSLVPKEPSLLFTNSGMVQLIPFFTGKEEPPYPRLCNYQPSFRTVDIDNVGKNGRNLTFFEMLGNWSIGDYYKDEAVSLAFELVTEVFGFDPDRIYASVFAGYNDLPADEESVAAWKRMGIDESRIMRLPMSENFWIAGQTGPCGPCTEIYYDMGAELGEVDPSDPETLPGGDNDRFLEVWNAGVFMQYYKDEAGNYTPLPKKHVDTGAGLERMAAFLQGKKNVYDIDVFRPLVEMVAERLGGDYDNDPRVKKACRIVSDHVRAATFLIADGVRPGNSLRDYVLRRLLRRAVRQLRLFEVEEAFLGEVSGQVISSLEGAYPKLDDERESIVKVIADEEATFSQTLQRGMRELTKILDQTTNSIGGKDAFLLYDTYGFPLELTQEIAGEQGVDVDVQGFEQELQKQVERSRAHSGFTIGKTLEKTFGHLPQTDFVGYESLQATAEVLQIESQDEEVQLVLSKTPFYGEGGGQAGDKGEIVGPEGRVKVTTTKKTKQGVFVHVGVLEGQMAAGDRVEAQVDKNFRGQVTRYHTATHLLHWALREVLGQSVEQKGSSITDRRLRFDFSHDASLTAQEWERVQILLDEKIAANLPVGVEVTSLKEAKARGAMALFEGKYDQEVRLVTIGDGLSQELCGGTHVKSTGEIGTIKIKKQQSVAAGIRRLRLQ